MILEIGCTYELNHRGFGSTTTFERAAEIVIEPEYKLKALTIEPRFTVAIGRLVEEVNALKHFTVRGTPPPGAPRFSSWGTIHLRSDASAGAALDDLLNQHGYHATPKP